MPTYLHPDIYVEEFLSSPMPNLALGGREAILPDPTAPPPRFLAEHSIAAFLGATEHGPGATEHGPGEVTLVRSWREFTDQFGDVHSELELPSAVFGFFANGGRACHILRLADVDLAALTGGLEALDRVADVSVVCAPDIMGALARGHLDPVTAKAMQSALERHCRRGAERTAILDPPREADPQQVRTWRTDVLALDSSYAATYYPWIQVADPTTGLLRSIPPSGHVAGVYARIDALRGFHHSPANETIKGAVDLDAHLHWSEQNLLHPIGINALIATPGRGVVVWGARTLSADPAWRHVRHRRLVNFAVRNIRAATGWVIFDDPDDPGVRRRAASRVAELCELLYRSGALWGADPTEAYAVTLADAPSTGGRAFAVDCTLAPDRDTAAGFRLTYFCD